jgi:hypothetical protein
MDEFFLLKDSINQRREFLKEEWKSYCSSEDLDFLLFLEEELLNDADSLELDSLIDMESKFKECPWCGNQSITETTRITQHDNKNGEEIVNNCVEMFKCIQCNIEFNQPLEDITFLLKNHRNSGCIDSFPQIINADSLGILMICNICNQLL